MKRAVLAAWLFALCVFGGSRAPAEDVAIRAETWMAEWSNRLSEERGEWVFEWTEQAGALRGTVKVDGVSYAVEGTRAGAWREFSWKNAQGRVTQVRAAGGASEWRGTVLSGGDGGLVTYARVSARRAG